MQELKKLWASLKAFGNVPITQDVLYDSLKAYQAPADKVSQLVTAGFLLRIRRGLYCVSPDITGAPLALGLVANHLHGPSYVSFETALALYGIIPERTVSEMSAVCGRGRTVQTSLGRFVYIAVPDAYYPIGVISRQTAAGTSFLMASPEKALADTVLRARGLRVSSPEGLRRFLEEDLRCDFDRLNDLHPNIFTACALTGRKRLQLLALRKVLAP